MGENLKFLRDVLPAVVNIHAKISDRNPSILVLGKERMGTGAVVHPKGYVLTVGYVVIGAEKLTVSFHDQRQFPAELVYQDFESGLAVIRVHESDLPAVNLSDPGGLQPGMKVLTLSTTGLFEHRGASGFVTSVAPFDAQWEYAIDDAVCATTENPGFGGGPLLDLGGRVVGTVYLNLNYLTERSLSIPTGHFHRIKDELFSTGKVTPCRPLPYLGIFAESTEGGVMVTGQFPGGPAERSDLQLQDLILEVSGAAVTSRREFYNELWKRNVGDEIALTVRRNDRRITVQLCGVDRRRFFGRI